MKTVREQFEKSVLAGDIEAALLVINTARFQYSPLDLYDEVIVPTQTTMGEFWHAGKISVADEHLASQITSAAMTCLRDTPYVCLPIGCAAVVTTLENELHEFGARAFSDCLQFDGWNVHYLGANTPAQDLFDYAVKHGIELIAVSITFTESLPHLQTLHQLVNSTSKGPALLAGGAGVYERSEQLKPDSRFAIAGSFREGLVEARRLVGFMDAARNLERTLVTLGNGLRLLRKQKKLSQQELANCSGIDRTYLSMLESGKQNPSLSVLSKISSVLKISVPELLCSYLLQPDSLQKPSDCHMLANTKRKIVY